MNINDLPPEIAALARKRQQECASTHFSKSTDRLVAAFDFYKQEESAEFWHKIDAGNYAPFYEEYGRPAEEWVPKVGEKIIVWDILEEEANERMFLFKNGNYFVCMDGITSLDRPVAKNFYCYQWEHGKPLPTPRRVTRAEIAEALNIEGDNFEIID